MSLRLVYDTRPSTMARCPKCDHRWHTFGCLDVVQSVSSRPVQCGCATSEGRAS